MLGQKWHESWWHEEYQKGVEAIFPPEGAEVLVVGPKKALSVETFSMENANIWKKDPLASHHLPLRASLWEDQEEVDQEAVLEEEEEERKKEEKEKQREERRKQGELVEEEEEEAEPIGALELVMNETDAMGMEVGVITEEMARQDLADKQVSIQDAM